VARNRHLPDALAMPDGRKRGSIMAPEPGYAYKVSTAGCAGVNSKVFSMSSLSIDYGRKSNKNFFIDEHEIAGRQGRSQSPIGSPWTAWSVESNSYRKYNLDIYQGRNIPDFHKRRNRGELLPMTDYLYAVHSRQTTGASNSWMEFTKDGTTSTRVEMWWKDFGNEVIQSRHLSTPFQYATNPRIVAQSLGIEPRYYAQLAAAKLYSRGWDAGTFLAEIHKTVSMFRGCVFQFAKLWDAYLTDLKRWKLAGQVKNAVDQTFNAWLEGRYGWRILMYDIEDINKLLVGLKKKSRTRHKERVGTDQTFQVTESNLVESKRYYKLYLNDTVEMELGVRGRIVADFVPDLAFANLPITLYELTPYSFVLDWLVNIGNALAALSFLALNDQYTCSHSVGAYTTITQGYSVVLNDNAAGLSTNWTDISITDTIEWRDRRPCYVPTVPIPRLSLNIAKVTDLIALLWKVGVKL